MCNAVSFGAVDFIILNFRIVSYVRNCSHFMFLSICEVTFEFHYVVYGEEIIRDFLIDIFPDNYYCVAFISFGS